MRSIDLSSAWGLEWFMPGPGDSPRRSKLGLILLRRYVRWRKVPRREMKRKGVWRGLGVMVVVGGQVVRGVAK